MHLFTELKERQDRYDVPEKDEEQPMPPPWMKDRALRKTNRPSPLKATHKDVANNNTNTMDSTKNSENIYDNQTPTKWRTSTSVIGGKEILAPLKRSSVIDNIPQNEADENTPPPPHTQHETLFIHKDELPQKTTLPPLR